MKPWTLLAGMTPSANAEEKTCLTRQRPGHCIRERFLQDPVLKTHSLYKSGGPCSSANNERLGTHQQSFLPIDLPGDVFLDANSQIVTHVQSSVKCRDNFSVVEYPSEQITSPGRDQQESIGAAGHSYNGSEMS